MKIFKSKLASLIAVCVAPAAFAITNPGFETGNFNGWTVSNPGAPSVVVGLGGYNAIPAAPTDGRHYGPTVIIGALTDNPIIAPGGNFFAKLTASGSALVNIKQSFSMDLAYGITGVAAFDAVGTASGGNDIAQITISSATYGTQVLWSRTISNVGNNFSSPWEIWTYYAPGMETYTLTFSVKNIGNTLNNSVALLDAIQIVQVPDNGSTLLMLGGVLVGFLGLKRKLVKA